MASRKAMARRRAATSKRSIARKWKDLSWYKQGLILVIVIFFLYNITANIDVILGAVRRFLNVLAPFIIGCMIAYFLSRPVIKLDERLSRNKSPFIKRKSHVLATIAVFIVVIVIVTVIVSHVSPIIVGNLRDFTLNLPIYYHNAINWARELGADHWLYRFLPDIPYYNDEVTTDILDAFAPDAEIVIDSGILTLLTSALGAIVINLVSVGTSLLNFAMGMVVALYLLLYRTTVIALVDRIATVFIKPRPLKFLKTYLHKSNEVFYKFISAQFLDACILGTLSFILLAALGVEYALTLALLLGISNMIPFFGSIFASLVTTVVTLFTGGLQQAVFVLIALIILQQVDANFISPKITSEALGLNPLLIIASIFIGGAYFGIVGMFIAVPVATMCKIFLEDYLIMREKKLGIKPKSLVLDEKN